MQTKERIAGIPTAEEAKKSEARKRVRKLTKEEKIFNLVIFVMSGRIPDPFDEFHKYITEVMPWLKEEDPVTHISNGIRLGMVSDDVDKGQEFLNKWTSGDALHPKIYENQADKTNVNEKTTLAYHNFESDFNGWFHGQLDLMAASPNRTADDLLRLNIKGKPATHHRLTGEIAEIPKVGATLVGNGIIKLDCAVVGKNGKPGIPASADAVEIVYACYGKADPADPELNGKWKKEEPANYTGCSYRENHTRAVFEMNVGVLYSGMNIKGWARYVDHANPARNGKWGNPFSLMIP